MSLCICVIPTPGLHGVLRIIIIILNIVSVSYHDNLFTTKALCLNNLLWFIPTLGGLLYKYWFR